MTLHPVTLFDDPPRPGPLRIVVPGIPKPQGSVSGIPLWFGRPCPACKQRRFGGVRITYLPSVRSRDNRKQKALLEAFEAWRRDVTRLARAAMAGRPPISGPVGVLLTFTVPRPAGHYGTGRNAGAVKASAPDWPDVKPDGPKYQRAVEDSLTDAGVWGDDAQVVAWHGFKVYPKPVQGTAGLRVVTDPAILCASPGADALPQPGVVIRVWAIPRGGGS